MNYNVFTYLFGTCYLHACNGCTSVFGFVCVRVSRRLSLFIIFVRHSLCPNKDTMVLYM